MHRTIFFLRIEKQQTCNHYLLYSDVPNLYTVQSKFYSSFYKVEKSVVIFNVKLARTLGSILKMKASRILLKADLGTLDTEFERERTRRLERIVLARLPICQR